MEGQDGGERERERYIDTGRGGELEQGCCWDDAVVLPGRAVDRGSAPALSLVPVGLDTSTVLRLFVTHKLTHTNTQIHALCMKPVHTDTLYKHTHVCCCGTNTSMHIHACTVVQLCRQAHPFSGLACVCGCVWVHIPVCVHTRVHVFLHA